MQHVMMLFFVNYCSLHVSQYSDLGHGVRAALLSLISRAHDIDHPHISSRWIIIRNINAPHVYI